jgi:hypothetical protein
MIKKYPQNYFLSKFIFLNKVHYVIQLFYKKLSYVQNEQNLIIFHSFNNAGNNIF